MNIVGQVNESMWELGDALCDTWVALDVGSCTASILNLAAISVDRCVIQVDTGKTHMKCIGKKCKTHRRLENKR